MTLPKKKQATEFDTHTESPDERPGQFQSGETGKKDESIEIPGGENEFADELDFEFTPTQLPEPAGSLDLKNLELKSKDPQSERERRKARAQVLRLKNRLRSRKRAG